MTVAMRRELCAVMEYRVIEGARSVLYNDGDVIDSWTAILNGSVEVVYPDGHAEELHDRCVIILCETAFIQYFFRVFLLCNKWLKLLFEGDFSRVVTSLHYASVKCLQSLDVLVKHIHKLLMIILLR